MPPKKKATAVKAGKALAKTPKLGPKEKPPTMSQEDWMEEKRRCAFVTADRRRRKIAAEASKAEAALASHAADVCLSLGGRGSPSLPGYFTEPPSISQMRLSQMEGHARYSPEFADSDTIQIDPNATFSPDAPARGSGAFRFAIDLNRLWNAILQKQDQKMALEKEDIILSKGNRKAPLPLAAASGENVALGSIWVVSLSANSGE